MTDPTELPAPLDFHVELDALMAVAGQWGDAVAAAYVQALQPGLGAWWLAALAMFGVGIVGERLVCWKLDGLNRRIVNAEASSWLSALGYGALRVMFDLVGALLFYAFAWATLYFTVDATQPIYTTLGAVLGAVLKFRVCMILVRAVLAPHAEGIRPLPMENADARSLYRGVMLFAGVYIAIVFNWGAVLLRVEPEVVGRATGVLIGLGLGAALVLMVWSNRRRLEQLFRRESSSDRTPSTLRLVFSQSWPYLFVVWVLLLWANWAFAVFTVDVRRENSAMLSWWITLLFPAIDRLVHVLLHKLVRVRLLEESGFESRRERFVTVVQSGVRVILIGVALIAMVLNWNLLGADVIRSALARQVILAAVEIGVIVLIAYVLYELVMSVLEKHVPAEGDDEQGEVEGEAGGTGATRARPSRHS